MSQQQSTYPHVPIAEMLQRIRKDNAGHGTKHVVILGAGIAGLVAAYELQQLGHIATILEGSERVGGRILTHRFKDGSYNELGAMRVPRLARLHPLLHRPGRPDGPADPVRQQRRPELPRHP